MAEIGSAFLSILPSAKGFGSKLESEVGRETSSTGKSIGSKFGTMFKVGAAATVGGGLLAANFLKGAFDEAREAQVIGAQTEAVIKSTGAAAGITAKQVGDLAGALSLKTGIDDEVIQSGQNMLLTFKNIRNEAGAGNDIFNQSTKALIDMSAAMGTEPKQAAIQLGKALNDPIKGISALSRVGIQFTDDQKKVITSLVEGGETAKAQKIILKELESQFGGSAEAQATAADKASVAWGNFKEQVGTLLLPVLDRLLTALSSKVIPAISGFVSGIENGTGAGGRFREIVTGIIDAARPVVAFLVGAVAAVRGFFTSLSSGGGGASRFRDSLTQVSAFVRGDLIPAIQGFVESVRGFITAALPIVQEFVTGMQARLAPMVPRIQAIFSTIGTILTSTFTIIAGVVRAGTAYITFMWEHFGSNLVSFLSGVLSGLTSIFGGALNIIKGILGAWIAIFRGDWQGLWNSLKTILSGALGVIKGLVTLALAAIKAALGAAWTVIKAAASAAWGAIKAMIAATWNAIKSVIQTQINAVKSALQSGWNAIKSVAQAAWNAVKTVIQTQMNAAKAVVSGAISAIKGAFNGIADLVGKVRNWFGEMVSAIKSKFDEAVGLAKSLPGRITGALSGLASLLYTKGAELIQGLVNGILSKLGAVGDAIGEVAGAIKDHLPGSPVKTGPLTVWNRGAAGKRLMQMLADGVKAGAPLVVNATKEMTEKLNDALEALREKMESHRDKLKGVLDGLRSDFASLKDSIAGAFTQGLFDFQAIAPVLAEAVPLPDDFADQTLEVQQKWLEEQRRLQEQMGTPGQSAMSQFMDNLLGTRGQLRQLVAAFKKLVKWGLPADFLSQLFASGNGGLILEMASGSRSEARQAGALFGQIESLSDRLGSQVAQNQYGDDIKGIRRELRDANKRLDALPSKIGREVGRAVNNAAADSQRRTA